ncbi:MAG: hypothetical protein AB7Q42_23080 [Acidimicrobiia bacterium]
MRRFAIGTAAAGLLLAACGSDDSNSNSVPAVTTAAKAATTAKSATTAASTATTAAKTATTAKSTATTAQTLPGASTLSLKSTSLGSFLIDKDGRTLYIYTKDSQNKASTCDAACATTWLPEAAPSSPSAGTGVTASKISEITRSDGTKQLAYNGWPLYRYSKDTASGETTGEGFGGTWYVVDAAGTAIK